MNNLVYESKYLRFYKYHPELRKTPIYQISPKNDDSLLLGQVKWFGPFRKYAFFPEPMTTYDSKCLESIIYFIENCAGKEEY